MNIAVDPVQMVLILGQRTNLKLRPSNSMAFHVHILSHVRLRRENTIKECLLKKIFY